MADLDPDDERALLQAWRGGDKRAGNELLEGHFTAVYRFFETKVDEHADDLAQRTFLACVESRDRFREDSSFRTYALGIARKQLLMHFRRGRRDREVSLHEQSIVDLGGSPSSVVAHAVERQQVVEALRRLPVDFQITLELYFWESMTMVAVAEVTGVSEGTVKSRLHRGKKLLRKELETLIGDSGKSGAWRELTGERS